MKKIVGLLTAVLAVIMILFAVKPSEEENKVVLPELLNGQSFVHDELEIGEGTALYTLIFTDSEYRLYQDNGVGIVAQGTVTAQSDKSLIFEGDEQISGFYSGSAFESPSVTITYEGKERVFTPATDTTEYVYLSYLGAYESEISDKPALIILERWFEFYIYTNEKLIRGNYEIYEDGRAALTTYEGKSYELKKDDLVRAEAKETYEAAHAMGAYTLRTYEADVFTIHGADGLLKAMGTINIHEESGTAAYFPRMITAEVENDDKFQITFSCQNDILTFPDSTYLLPRSGNIDEETGTGTYWSAGTALEFIKQQEGISDEDHEQILKEIGESDKNTSLSSNLPQDSKLLKQSMPSVGTAKPLVLLIDFPDYHRPRFVTAQGMEETLFSVENKDSLSAFYYISSYGNLTIDGTVLDWYRANKNRDEYESDKEIMAEAIDYYIENEGLNLADYDANGDGEVDSLYVLWAGNLQQDDGIWSVAYRSTWSSSPTDWERKVRGYIFVPGNTVWSSVPPLNCNLNSLTHETGHLLGLNDYYSYDTTDRNDDTLAYTGGALEGGFGGMDMMDANIGDHNAFSKWLLGWMEPEVVEYEDIATLKETEKVIEIGPSNETGDAIFIKLKSADSMYTEMLVIEVVSATRNAAELTRVKEPVVRILHVDASLDEDNLEGNWRSYGFKYDNSYTSTKFISLVEADGADESLNYLPATNGSKISYDMDDYFSAGAVLTPNGYPNTNGYDVYGNATVYTGLTIQVESISEAGKAVIRLGYEQEAGNLSLKEVSPEPTVVPYAEDNRTVIRKDTENFVFTFDREITLVNEAAESKIRVLSGNQIYEGFQVQTEGNQLIIQMEQELEENNDYTIVIPAGVISEKGNSSAVNRFNSIYGFVTEKE